MKMFVRSRSPPVDPVEAENLFRARSQPRFSVATAFAPAGHALDVARIGLATMLLKMAGGAHRGGELTRRGSGPRQYPVPTNAAAPPNSEARALAEIILQQQAPGALAEALELVEAIPAADCEGIEGSNCAYMLGKVFKMLDEETPNDEHARRAFQLINEAVGEGSARRVRRGTYGSARSGLRRRTLTAYTDLPAP